jgi:hypothetical protein
MPAKVCNEAHKTKVLRESLFKNLLGGFKQKRG